MARLSLFFSSPLLWFFPRARAIVVCGVLVLLGILPCTTVAQAAAQAGPRGPTPAENLGVLQNRELAAVQKPLFGTQNKLELSLHSGLLPIDPYVLGAIYGAQGTLHLDERLGLELALEAGTGWDTYASKALREQGIRVDAYFPRAVATLGAVYTPVYAKLNLLGKQVVHFDVALTAGAGMFLAERTLYNDTESAEDARRYSFPLSVHLGILERYYLTLFQQQWAIRLDARDHLTWITNLDGTGWLKHNLAFGVGVSWFMPLKAPPGRKP